MKRILVVFTGGTIGSKVSNNTIDVDEQAGYLLIEKFKEKSKYNVEFVTMQPLNILSENCIPKDWSKIINALHMTDMNSMDGVIITHGTDTLPYTSAMISYVFADTKIPIILTASNYALDQPNGNGLRNFISSIEFICHSSIPGVFTIFEDEKGIERIYLGSRMSEADPFNDQFTSYGGVDLGYLKGGMLIRNDNKVNPTIAKLKENRESLPLKDIEFNNKILTIRPFPGLDYSFFRFDSNNKPRAIVHKLYHSSTACVRDGSVSLVYFMKYCKEEGIDLYLASFKNTTDDMYITSQELLDNAAIPLHNISMEAAVSKLWLAYNQDIMEPREFVMKKLYFEFLE
jgi:L-asparaginase